MPSGPPHRPPPASPSVRRSSRGASERSDGWRWLLALGLVVAAVVAVIVFDRTSGPAPAESAAPTTVGSTTPERERPPVAEGELPVPDGLTGVLYALGEDERLIEVDLATGRSRQATLRFPVEPWFVNQVVALRDVVLVTTRRTVFAVDRAGLVDQHQLAEERWVVGSPDGEWAALVPYGAGAGAVIVLDGSGAPTGDTPLQLPAGATVQGAVDDGLVIDAAGTLRVLGLDGQPGPVIGTGRFLAAGASAVARIVCQETSCTVLAGTLAQPDAFALPTIDVAGPWYFGAAAVFDPLGQRMAAVTGSGGSVAVAKVYALAAQPLPPVLQSPAAVAAPGPIPALAFTADGSTVAHTSPTGVTLWRVGEVDGTPSSTDELPFSAPLLALTVTPQPPPPPPQSSGPPPSYA